MKLKSLCNAALLLALAAWHTDSIHAATVFFQSDFQSGTVEGWEGAQPTHQATGGPGGAGDMYLQLQATGTNGPNSVPATYNDGADWVGDFTGISGVTVDMLNQGNVPLDMRVVLFGPPKRSNRWTSSDSAVLPADGTWHSFEFLINDADLTSVQGSSDYNDMILDVQRFMFRHDPGTPSAGGQSQAAFVGLDNIRLVPEPSSLRLAMALFAILPMLCRRKK